MPALRAFLSGEKYMFVYKKGIWQSSVLKSVCVTHGFSTRLGGVSRAAHLRSMNTGFFRGEDDPVVLENIGLLCDAAGASHDVVCTPQIHSNIVRYVTRENIGEGSVRDVPFSCDGFVTDVPGVTLLVRVADCVPILLAGEKAGGSPVIGAVHAGWRGTVAGIAEVAVKMMCEKGAKNIRAAVGASIHSCCYQVGEDFCKAVSETRGEEFLSRHVRDMHADLQGMNLEILNGAGVDTVDIIDECTNCKPYLYHSHRATNGVRGTMGAVISITEM